MHAITADKIDDVICAEIPDLSVDPAMSFIKLLCPTWCMHGPYGCINPIIPLARRMVTVTQTYVHELHLATCIEEWRHI